MQFHLHVICKIIHKQAKKICRCYLTQRLLSLVYYSSFASSINWITTNVIHYWTNSDTVQNFAKKKKRRNNLIITKVGREGTFREENYTYLQGN